MICYRDYVLFETLVVWYTTVIKFLGEQMVSKKVTGKAIVVEDKPLHDYELVLIFSPELEEEEFSATIDNVTQLITGKGGVISEVEQWGKRKLAYPIKRSMEGNYVLIRLKMKPQLTKEFEASLQISEEILRQLLIKLGD